MIYLERTPCAELRPWIRSIWYCRAPAVTHTMERVLPNGCIQIVISLARDHLLDCPSLSEQVHAPPALIMGARANYELISTADLAELAGIVIRPGGFATLFRERADLLFGRWTALHDLWPRFAADAILDAPSAAGKLDQLERLLRNRAAHANYPACLVHGAIEFLNCPNATVAACVKESGVSARRFSQVFREHVGLSPKLWSRIQRFQKAVRLLYEGVDLRWAELALDCGYYDQSHFINDFQAFSGINPTTYSGLRGRWQNHISVEG